MKLKSIYYLIATIAFTCFNCTQSSQQENGDHQHAQEHGVVAEPDSNEVLFDQVMDIHDEAMAKMDQIYALKEDLKEQVENSKEIVEEKRREVESTILKLDSAGKGMMIWMRKFQPDSLTGEEYREYLESELEKVKKVRDDIYQAIEEAKEEKN